jgi:hypothetical protein
LRRPESLLRAQFWAEDANVFFYQARELGLAALIEPYAGYLHLLPRLVAALASWLDLGAAPLLYSVAAGLGTLYVAALTLGSRFPLPASPVYALLLALVPDAFEVLWHLTNLQWVLCLGLLVIVMQHAPASRWATVHDLSAVLVIGLTGPFVLTLLPLAVWRCWRERSRFSAARLLVCAVCALVQAGHLLPLAAGLTGAARHWDLLLAVGGTRVAGSLFLGGCIAPSLLMALGLALGVTLVIVGAVATWRCRRSPAHVALLWAATSWCLLGLERTRGIGAGMLPTGLGERYFFPVQAALLWWLAAHLFSGKRGEARVALFILGIFVGANLHRWREAPLVDFGWRKVADEVRAGATVEARINPNWSLVVHGLKDAAREQKRRLSGPVSASLRAADRELNPEGDRMSLLATASSPGDESGVVWEIVLPAHWVLLGLTSPDGLITRGPLAGATGTLSIPLNSLPGGRAEFTLQVSYPPDGEAAEMRARVGRSAGEGHVWFAVEPARWRNGRR